MNVFCCNWLKAACERCSMVYDPVGRSFAICKKGDPEFGWCIDYCPFCGKKVIPCLIDVRWNIILEEYGPDYLPEDDGSPGKREKDLPEEFKTDEWWKKRGL